MGASKRKIALRSLAVMVVACALLVAGVALDVGGLGKTYDRVANDLNLSFARDIDSDGDGLIDKVEKIGLTTLIDGAVVTDAHNSDTDGDGLSDGVEAGVRATRGESEELYVTISNPRRADTDGDGLEDGDEYLLDTNSRRRDTDGDGLRDDLELDFGSDPTLDDPDSDGLNDKEEHDRGSDPMSYNLTRKQTIAAFAAGTAVGNWRWAARHLGMREEQLTSTAYLMGSLLTADYLPRDITDLLADIEDRDALGVADSLFELAPYVGKAKRLVTPLRTFAQQGNVARRAISIVIQRLPFSPSTKKKLLKQVFGKSLNLPGELAGGPEHYAVYLGSSNGSSYVGITRDLGALRKAQGSKGRGMNLSQLPGANNLSRGEARAINEACVVRGKSKTASEVLENRRHSIDPREAYYEEAVAWGDDKLKAAGAKCP